MKLKCHIHTSGLSCPLLPSCRSCGTNFAFLFLIDRFETEGTHSQSEGKRQNWGEGEEGRGGGGGGGGRRERGGRKDCFTKRAASLY